MTAIGTIFRRKLGSYFAIPLTYVFTLIFLTLSDMATFYLGDFFERGRVDLASFFSGLSWLYLLLILALAMRLWAEERKSGFIEMLMTLPVSCATLVTGKFLAAWLCAGLALLLTFPIPLTVNYLGSPDNGAVIAGYLAGWLLPGGYLAIGSYMSALTKNQIIAFALTVLVCLLLAGAGTPHVQQAFSGWFPQWLLDGIASLSVLVRFEALGRGVLDVRDLAYFFSLIVAWLVATTIIIDLKKTVQEAPMKRTLYSGVGPLLVDLLLLALNLLSSLLLRDQQFDLTQQKLYTFSAGTQEVLDNLDELLNLYLFFSKSRASDLPALRNYARRVKEVLDLYARRSHDNVRLFVIDPLPFSDDEDRATRFDLQALPIGTNGEVIYFGLAVTNATDGLQVIPFFSPKEEPLLEYDLNRLVQVLAQRERTVVGLMSSLPMAGQAPTDGQLGNRPRAVMDKLYQQFDTRTLGLASTEIPADILVLMLVHPRQSSEQTQYAIDQFVLRDGKLLAFVDPLSLTDADGGKGSDLAPLLCSWGAQLRPDILPADASFAMIKPNAERHPERNPTWLHLPDDTFPHDDVLITGLGSLNLISVGLFEPLGGALTRFIPLLHSSAYSMPLSLEHFRQSSTEQLDATLVPTGERYVLAAKVEGSATSAFLADHGKQDEGPSDSANIRVLLVADTNLLGNPLWLQEQLGHSEPQAWADNNLFVSNALDYLSGSDALIDLRLRGHTKHPFTRVEAPRRGAGMRAQEQLNALQQSLNDTDKNLWAPQQSMDNGGQEMTPEMEATLYRFIDGKLHIRQQLCQLQLQLNVDVERLAEQVKLANTVLLPALLALLLLLHWNWRSMRQRRG